MKNIVFIVLFSLFVFFILKSDPIAPSLTGDNLITYLVDNYKPAYTLGYNTARDTLYGVIDKHKDSLTGIYSGYTIYMQPGQDPSTWAYDNGIDCEHVWPKSMGAGYEPAKSDMHHLFPCKSNVNSSRSNDPFGECIDSLTDRWYRLDSTNYTIPSSFINEWAEKDNDVDLFEPRESVKGNIARCMFYFYTMYEQIFLDTTAGTSDTLFFELQKETLRKWNYDDPPNSVEVARTWKIASYQDSKPNPFVLDYTLVDRAYFPDACIDKWHPKRNIENRSVFLSSDNIRFSFYTNNTGTANIRIYSISGREIVSLQKNIETKGQQSLNYNSGGKLGKGIYYYILNIDSEKIQSGKIIYVR
ncbi:MAG: T9SS type A sorting domain-containing protein [Proteobacteria bacterium]|nr:T9SS type A sorting domain-containing protein [Pseudomonadota bacterium]